jgi:ABC-2 type transport system ATP-binding protein
LPRAARDDLKSELQGDTVQVELTDLDEARARLALERVSGVGEVTVEGRTLRTRANDGGAAIPAVLAALDTQGVRAASVTLARPSLDDVYLRYAGRSFHRADVEQEEVAT